MTTLPSIRSPNATSGTVTQPEVRQQLSCVQNALATLRVFFEKIGLLNFIGCSVVILSFAFLSNTAAAVAFGLFGVGKIAEKVFYKVETRPAPVPSPLPLLPATPLPPGSIHSQYCQSNIANHTYDLAEHVGDLPDLMAALQRPIPFQHNMTCCAITATIIDFFYEHGFQNLTPFRLDALLAKGIRNDAAIRVRGGLGNGPIDVAEFFENAEGEVPHVNFNLVQLPTQIVVHDEQSYHQILNQFPLGQRSAGFLYPQTPRGHFTGLYREIDGRFYVSESRNRFLNNVQYAGGQGALVYCLGNTVEGAARQMAALYPGVPVMTFYPCG